MHLRKHMHIKPFQCPYCKKYYISKWNMIKHQKKGCIYSQAIEEGLPPESNALEPDDPTKLGKRKYVSKKQQNLLTGD